MKETFQWKESVDVKMKGDKDDEQDLDKVDSAVLSG